MISNERLEIISYIISRKNLNEKIFLKICNVQELSQLTKEQGFYLEQLLALL